jgi:hypothetical protein
MWHTNIELDLFQQIPYANSHTQPQPRTLYAQSLIKKLEIDVGLDLDVSKIQF